MMKNKFFHFSSRDKITPNLYTIYNLPNKASEGVKGIKSIL